MISWGTPALKTGPHIVHPGIGLFLTQISLGGCPSIRFCLAQFFTGYDFFKEVIEHRVNPSVKPSESSGLLFKSHLVESDTVIAGRGAYQVICGINAMNAR